jgi:hypothetical protein
LGLPRGATAVVGFWKVLLTAKGTRTSRTVHPSILHWCLAQRWNRNYELRAAPQDRNFCLGGWEIQVLGTLTRTPGLPSSTHSDFDRDFDSIGKVRFSHESYRVHCDPQPSVDPSVTAVPEVPTAWLLLLGSLALLGARRLRGGLSPLT